MIGRSSEHLLDLVVLRITQPERTVERFGRTHPTKLPFTDRRLGAARRPADTPSLPHASLRPRRFVPDMYTNEKSSFKKRAEGK